MASLVLLGAIGPVLTGEDFDALTLVAVGLRSLLLPPTNSTRLSRVPNCPYTADLSLSASIFPVCLLSESSSLNAVNTARADALHSTGLNSR